MKTIVFTFARLQPLSAGHDRVFRKMLTVSRRLHADNIVYVSQTQKLPNDPLPWAFKLSLLRSAHPMINTSEDVKIKTPFQALEHLAKLGYERVILVVGDDRMEEFKSKMLMYANQWGIKRFSVISAGSRDPNADGLDGVSATKLRALAAHGESEAFKSGLSQSLSDDLKELVYDNLRQAMAVA